MVKWIYQSISAIPSTELAVGALTALIILALSCFQKRETAFLVSSRAETLRAMYFSSYSLSMFRLTISLIILMDPSTS